MINIVFLGLLGLCASTPLAQSDLYNPPIYREPSQRFPSPQAEQYRPDPPTYKNKYEEPEYFEDEEQNVNTIPGEPGKDYPVHSFIPNTGFSCSDKLPGFYADDAAHCQVWHYCKTDGLKESFLCPNGTIYNQENRVCEWWFNVRCDQATIAAQARVNEDLYIVPQPFKAEEDQFESPPKYSSGGSPNYIPQRRFTQDQFQESPSAYSEY
ncbi:hypothetical protein SK128_018848 [Halocaridina rubra]|uniref:Chitin-binding type-2 domain-containing protein n=1 Tax=Halocaridina rubra TaxID=373956 RepID=A0AAN9AG90_HALRR